MRSSDCVVAPCGRVLGVAGPSAAGDGPLGLAVLGPEGELPRVLVPLRLPGEPEGE